MEDRKGEHPWGDAGQLVLFGLFLAVWALDSFVLHATTVLTRSVPLALRLAVAFVLLAGSIVLLRMGRIAVTTPMRPARVIDTGAFRFTRHPLYLSGLLFYLALAAATLSLASFAVVAGIFIFYDFIASFEERVMEHKFGEAYRAYRKRTGKWGPRLLSR
ncbi:MAG: isoprenylcysteine carboxylmethyltransferase family protein [Candidatus Eisenbacteria bacterium]|nr:isoprenylcysteine carboxylmethyltransferase family protein [Candidatus Eisenbacteria bacterium]